MKTLHEIKIFFVDKDMVLFKSMSRVISCEGKIRLEYYPSVKTCMRNLDKEPDLILLNLKTQAVQ